MSEGYGIELYFDPALENQVLKAWNVIARRQISTKLINNESRPHINLLSTSFFDSTRLEPVVRNFVSKQEPLSVSFSTIGTFSSDNNVVFLSPTPSLSLLQLQSQLCDTVKKESVEISEEYLVDSWVPFGPTPFCPVALDVSKSRMAEAFSVLRDFKLPVNGYGMEIDLVEFSPVREVFSFALGNNNNNALES